MTAHSIDHVEFFVGDVYQASHYYCGTYGFQVVAEAGPLTGLAGARSLVLAHGGVRLVLTSALHADHAASRFVRRHGDGVRDVALRSTDAVGDFERAVAAGADAVAEPETFEDADGRVTRATIAATNDLVHTFVQRDDPSGPFLPGRYRPIGDGVASGPALLRSVDHLALCLRAGSLDTMVDFYQRALGLRHTYDEYIVIGGQAMASKVVQDETRGITFTMVEPDPVGDRGQLNDFLDGFDGPGVQHVAYGTDDIVRAARELRDSGVELLSTPAGYYSSLADRGIEVDIDPAVLQELGLLADRDEWGQLVQVFTRSPYARRTVFFELIQRLDARTFGSGNIKALYEAVERERGTDPNAAVPVGAAARAGA
ncbi:4-hydroxyphenylpyruvate dioxygenase [Streptomyces inhibens]|uniref:4-hydroxyphenylpyruvate dioxygenase n=1 Tax=Streptomyces inhibens TaxID=2293571 RepID=A0A371QAE2_STRIH|nr:4-hydroxyphenylpyruvate dioxygenase [Streptomyces inhibens]REK91685.1 4-hydroxyphenylpyruvate dioxygenase [Streptomyces inhibens]